MIEVLTSPLALPPAPDEEEAIRLAVPAALGLTVQPAPAEAEPWRFAGRWWPVTARRL